MVQLAAAGARVIALTSSAGKVRATVALGARHGFALQEVPDPVAAVLSAAGGRGADVVYDAGGRDTFEMSLDMLATRGTLVLYGQSSGPVASFDPGRLSGITGAGRGAGSLTLRWVAASDYLTSQAERAAAVSVILAEARAGRSSPRIAGCFPLHRASDAHASLASRTVLGKYSSRHDQRGDHRSPDPGHPGSAMAGAPGAGVSIPQDPGPLTWPGAEGCPPGRSPRTHHCSATGSDSRRGHCPRAAACPRTADRCG